MKKIWYNWSKPKKVISIICICLCSVLLTGCVVNIFAGKDGGSGFLGIGDKISNVVGLSKTRNTQNLLDPEYYTDLIEGDHNGVDVTVNKDGSITLDGKATADTSLSLANFSIEKVEGYYFTVGAVDLGDDAESSYFYFGYNNAASCEQFIYSNQSVTFVAHIDGINSPTFSLCIAKGDSFDNVTIYPVLNYGFVAQPYFEAADSFGDKFDSLIGSKKERNELNLFDPEYYTDLIEGEHSGVDVTVNKDGSITLDGKATTDINLKLGEFDSKQILDRFVCFSGAYCGEDASGVTFNLSSSGSPIFLDFVTRFDVVSIPSIELSDSSYSVEINLHLGGGDSFDNVTIYPVLNYGITAVPYFK